MDRGEGASRLDELNQLIAVLLTPLVAEGPSERRAKGEGAPKLVEVQH